MNSKAYTIDEQYLVDTLKRMVNINSVNPSLTPEGKGEAELGVYVAEELDKLGLETTYYEIEPTRANTVGVLKGSGEGRSLLLNAHLDTVGVEGMTIDPFGAQIKDGRLYGRGSQDMKASLAAMMAVAKAFVDAGITLGGDLLITGVADEEYASIGTETLIEQFSADAVIVTEPTDMQICRAHRGFIWYDVETIGRAAHGSRYAEGIDANMRMGRFLSQLDILEQELLKRDGHPLTGPPSLHAARLRGGAEVSIYAASCLLQMERRTAPGETQDQATAELQEIIDRLSAADESFKATVMPTFRREPFVVAEDAQIVQILEGALQNRIGTKPPHVGQTFWTDAALFAEAGMETVLIGPTGYGLHSAEEWVDIQSTIDLAYVLADTAIKYCG